MTERLLAEGDVGNKTNILVCGGCVKCDGDVLMLELPKLTREIDESISSWIERYIFDETNSNGVAYVFKSFHDRDAKEFAYDISDLFINHQLYDYLDACIDVEWNEGVLICEREIAKRGLNRVEVKERFEL